MQKAGQESLRQSEEQRAELQRQLDEANSSTAAANAIAADRVLEMEAAQARISELQLLFEEQVALAESLKVKLATQEESHSAEVWALEQRLQDLRTALQKLELQSAEVKDQRDSANAANAALQQSVAESSVRAEELLTALDGKTEEVTVLQETIAANEAALVVAVGKLQNAEAMYLAQCDTVAVLDNARDALTAELAQKSADLEGLKQQRDELTRHIDATERALAADLDAAVDRNAELLGQLDQQIALVAALKLKLKALLEQAEESAHQLVHETAALEQCRAELSAATSSLTQCQHECDAKVAALVEGAVQSQKVQELMAAKLNGQDEEVAALQGQVSRLTDSLAKKTAEVDRLETDLASAQSERAAAQRLADARLKEAEARLVELRADQSAQEAYIGEVDAQRKAFKADLAVKVGEIARLEDQLEKLVGEAREHVAQIAKLRVQLAAAQARLEEEGHARIHQLAIHEQKLSELEVAKVASDHALQRYEAKVAALTAEIDAFGPKKSERMSI
jgi:chromosome segregation ATPase